MKRYTKEIDGRKVIKAANKIIIIKDDMQTFNPSEEMILADGWVEYVPPTYTPVEREETLEMLKQRKKYDIQSYDMSEDVNGFTINGEFVWLDKNTRAGLMLRLNAEEAIGKVETTLWYNDKQFTLEIAKARMMLYAIENYASACYDNTQRHLAEVEKLTTKEEVEAYEFKVGYPSKLEF